MPVLNTRTELREVDVDTCHDFMVTTGEIPRLEKRNLRFQEINFAANPHYSIKLKNISTCY